MKIEYINFNEDELLNPEIKRVSLSGDSKILPPTYCLPWVEASHFTIQIKSNENYLIKKEEEGVRAWIVREGEKKEAKDIWIKVPEKFDFLSVNEEEKNENKISLGVTPSYSSPWQKKMKHSVTLKMGICWWTQPGWGMHFTSAIHRNEEFRVVEGLVRTDLWNKDVPIVIRPLVDEVYIPKYSVIASALVAPVEDIELVSVSGKAKKVMQVVRQICLKRMNKSVYKDIVTHEKKTRGSKTNPDNS